MCVCKFNYINSSGEKNLVSKAVVLLSGGLDSATTLAIAKSEGYECYALSVNYHQRHIAELDAAKKIATQFKVKDHKTVEMDLSWMLTSALTNPDLKMPTELETFDEKGNFLIKIKKENVLHELVYATHPFDVVGWDGYNFPYGFSIHNFEPITGRVHLPPPTHQTFETSAFVICSFCPRLYDYHPRSIPAPYNHSNIDSDEVLYYVDGEFMSRNNIEQGHITLHPKGIPHGPAPGAMERSIGQKETAELAVMVDTFRPLQVTEAAMKIDDGNYYKSWVE